MAASTTWARKKGSKLSVVANVEGSLDVERSLPKAKDVGARKGEGLTTLAENKPMAQGWVKWLTTTSPNEQPYGQKKRRAQAKDIATTAPKLRSPSLVTWS
jgi:hypothetical protein